MFRVDIKEDAVLDEINFYTSTLQVIEELTRMLKSVHPDYSDYDYLIRAIYNVYLVLSRLTPQSDWPTFKERLLNA